MLQDNRRIAFFVGVLIIAGGAIGYLSADKLLGENNADERTTVVPQAEMTPPIEPISADLSVSDPTEGADAKKTEMLPEQSGSTAAGEDQPLILREFVLPGRTVEGREVEVIEMGSGDNTTLVMAGIHGDERSAPTVARQLVAYLKKNPRELDGRKVWVIPIANPDGWIRHTRQNANGVDLNRNFPLNWSSKCENKRYFPGPFAASEPETQGYIKFLKKYQPDKVISIHSPLHMMCPTGPGIPLAREMALYNGYPVDISVGYPTPGAMGDYCGLEEGLNLAIVALELPAIDGMQAWLDNKRALLHAIAYHVPEFSSAPAAGNAAKVKVRGEEMGDGAIVFDILGDARFSDLAVNRSEMKQAQKALGLSDGSDVWADDANILHPGELWFIHGSAAGTLVEWPPLDGGDAVMVFAPVDGGEAVVVPSASEREFLLRASQRYVCKYLTGNMTVALFEVTIQSPG